MFIGLFVFIFEHISFLKAKPEYICKFSRLQGLDVSNFAQSEGLKYYARTFVAALVPIIKAAANKCELDKLCMDEANVHRNRQVNEQIFLVSAFHELPIQFKPFLVLPIVYRYDEYYH